MVRGIDVSHYNGEVDWAGVARLGIEFAFAKATQGDDVIDAKFESNWKGMRDTGILRGAYHFIGLPSGNDDVHRQIDHFIATVGPLLPGDLPPALDLEDGDSPERWRQLIQSDRERALAVVRELIVYTTQQFDGIKPILYTGNFWWGQLGDPGRDEMPFGEFPLWFAQYPKVAPKSFGKGPKRIPRVWRPQWNFWQFSSSGKLPPAIQGNVDLDAFNGALEDLYKLCLPPAGVKEQTG
jgi:lysozyme